MLAHQPQSLRSVHSPQSLASPQTSTSAHSARAQSQSAQLPVAGPLKLPSTQPPEEAHQPQPLLVVHSPQVA